MGNLKVLFLGWLTILSLVLTSCNQVRVLADSEHHDGFYAVDAAKDAVSRYGDEAELEDLYILAVDSISDSDYNYYMYLHICPLPNGMKWQEVEDLIYREYCRYTPEVSAKYQKYRDFILENYNDIYPIYMHKVYRVTYSIVHDGICDTLQCGSEREYHMIEISGNREMHGLHNMGATEMAFVHELIPLYNEAANSEIKQWTINYIKAHHDRIVTNVKDLSVRYSN